MRGGENGGSHDGPANFGRRRRRSAREGERESDRNEGEGWESSTEREREMRRKEGDDDVFIYNLGKITINYPKVYS